VVHRDLKPENLFFHQEADGRTRIKVLDFGMARLLDQQAITTYGMALGTPSFMAPEQAAGRLDEIDGRTDLFALATTGFRLRTGRRIHEADHPVELVRRMSQVPAPPIRSLSPDASAPYARVIDKALQFRREDRYANAEAMQADVRRALTQLSYGAIAPPPLPAPAHRSVKRRGGVVWLALIACIGAGVALFVGSRMSGSGVASGPSASASSVIVDGGAPTRPWMDASTARPPGPIPMQRPVPVPPPNPSSR
jgi:serine/threonine-protein kinase